MGASLVVDAVVAGPVFLSGPVYAAALVGYWYSTGRGRHHYLPLAAATAPIRALAAATALIGLVPLFGPSQRGEVLFPVFFAWLGLLYVVGGLLDHVALRRAMAAHG